MEVRRVRPRGLGRAQRQLRVGVLVLGQRELRRVRPGCQHQPGAGRRGGVLHLRQGRNELHLDHQGSVDEDRVLDERRVRGDRAFHERCLRRAGWRPERLEPVHDPGHQLGAGRDHDQADHGLRRRDERGRVQLLRPVGRRHDVLQPVKVGQPDDLPGHLQSFRRRHAFGDGLSHEQCVRQEPLQLRHPGHRLQSGPCLGRWRRKRELGYGGELERGYRSDRGHECHLLQRHRVRHEHQPERQPDRARPAL
ncbi:MAG: hypothetical protein BWY59_00140 [Verrucomicrobia bacterium ADurb.Bin345]|nr:MAG: hypothetical protein BWY59_00140 [Verrucomicrobia bacterium ADurb.Bin345]